MLRIEGLSKTFANGTEALRGIDLKVSDGEILAVLGGSGCGKSTLLRLIAGLDVASAGHIRIDGEVVAGPHPAIGIVFQEPRLLPWLTVAGNIGFGIDNLPKPEQRQRIEQALSLIGLDGYGDRYPKELSGGQAQRVSIARALVAKPKVLLLDEPFSALDPFTRSSLHGQLIKLWKAYRPTLVLVTHDAEEAITLADRVAILAPKPGRLHEEVLLVAARPRETDGDSFVQAKRRVLASLHESLRAPMRREREPVDAGAGSWW
jgi:sulfonate transport system ATP-binding protein